MSKLFLTTLLALASNSVLAEWVEVEQSEIQATYANPVTIRTGWNKITMWLLSDFKAPRKYDGKLFLSLVSKNEYNCKERESQILSYQLLSEHMGKGDVVHSRENTNKWLPIPANSVDETLLKMACERR